MASEQSKQRILPDKDLTSCKHAGGNGTSGSSLLVVNSDSSSELDISPPDVLLLLLVVLYSIRRREDGLLVVPLPTTRIDSNSVDACDDSKSALLSDISFGREEDDEA